MKLQIDLVEALLDQRVTKVSQLTGGDLSDVYQLSLANGTGCIAKLGPDIGAEAEMLRAIGASGAPAPEVLALSDEILLMEELPSNGTLRGAVWASLAACLDRLHSRLGDQYGWHTDYAFGQVTICNTPTDDWPSFWGEHRILTHCEHVDAGLSGRLERLVTRLEELLPKQPTKSLLHGDLWGGNVLVTGDSVSGLIDPACYYGEREVDFAMLTLFNQPPPGFFSACDLEPGWKERLDIYLLWPLLVHLRLFGSSYRGSVEIALNRLKA